MAPDAKHVENLATLLEVKGAKPSPTPCSRATGRGQRDVLEPLTAAEATVFRRHGDCFVSRIRQVPSAVCDEGARSRHADAKKLSMLRLRRFVSYLLGAADVGPFFAYQDEPNTVLVWTDDDWSGNAVTCQSTSAGAVQLESHTFETWSVNQQVVSPARLRVSSTRSDQVVLKGSQSNTSCRKSFTPCRPTAMSR